MGSLEGRTVLLLGAGGAARGAVLAMNALGVGKIQILNRHADKAAALAAALKPRVDAQIATAGLADWAIQAAKADLVVNTTSAGMKGNPPLALDLAQLRKDAAVLDIVYNPLQTPFLKDAAARGHKTIDGLGMLMHQAVPSFEAFFGVRPEVTPGLRACLERALDHA
jgi:shikimate dehydrogenase